MAMIMIMMMIIYQVLEAISFRRPTQETINVNMHVTAEELKIREELAMQIEKQLERESWTVYWFWFVD
ncbi:hypothetical protein CCACVL1_27336 [Corchorus capsularis]|uniref:Uncharacterized protein n=1 Tax=Corchorus capsularis TaxID=210143 RepID=A0A1R3GB01_COCAP|nr:hypothetical protein CCACVL1_27336 [Corchorus capsularis]